MTPASKDGATRKTAARRDGQPSHIRRMTNDGRRTSTGQDANRSHATHGGGKHENPRGGGARTPDGDDIAAAQASNGKTRREKNNRRAMTRQ